MPIGAVESVVYGTDDIDAAVVFYDDFGLSLRSRSADEVVYQLEEGSRVIIRREDDPSLPAAHYEGNGVRETIFGISAVEELDVLAESLSVDREVHRDAKAPSTSRPTVAFRSVCGCGSARR